MMEHNGGDEPSHRAVNACARSVVHLDRNLQYLEAVVRGVSQNVAGVFGSGIVDLGDVVLVRDFVDTNQRENALDLVIGGELSDRIFVVVVGVDELE
jgi:hypothetical protein